MKRQRKVITRTISTTQRKLRHAGATLQLLQGSTSTIPLDREEVERRLNDFLTAADSVVDIMKRGSSSVHNGWFDQWWVDRRPEDRQLRGFMTKQRNAETHGQGATIRTTQQEISYLEYLQRDPAMQSGRHGGYYYRPQWSGPVGMEIPRTPVQIDILMLGDEEVAAKCTSYLRLLEQMV